MNEIEKRMEVLRKQLNDLIDDIDSCSGEEVLVVSQELEQARTSQGYRVQPE